LKANVLAGSAAEIEGQRTGGFSRRNPKRRVSFRAEGVESEVAVLIFKSFIPASGLGFHAVL